MCQILCKILYQILCHSTVMPSLVVIGQQIKEKQRGVGTCAPTSLYGPNDPSLNRVKVGRVPDFWEGQVEKGLNVEKWSFSQSLSRDFSRLSPTHQNTLFYTFPDQIHPPPPNLKNHQTDLKTVFLDKFQTVLSFVTLFLFWG